jgi:hypothetical protein
VSASVFWWYSAENLSPRITPAFLERQRRVLLPGQYAREHQNTWVDAADSFTIAADVDAAMGHGWTEQVAGAPGRAYQSYVDIGTVHDPTVIAIGHEGKDRVYIDSLTTFQGSHEAPVQLATVEAAVRDLAARFRVQTIRVESWQGVAAVQSLQRLRLPVELFTPTAKTNSEEWPVLAQRLMARTLVLPPPARLREELLNLVYEVGPTGVKVIDRGAVHQDHAVAVRGVVAALTSRARFDGGPVPIHGNVLRFDLSPAEREEYLDRVEFERRFPTRAALGQVSPPAWINPKFPYHPA